jgi:hypothetical protein
MDFNKLRAPIPHDLVKWRAQSITKSEPFKAMALAYVDARAVMTRLDEVCGPGGWQDSYVETTRGRVICTLSLLVDGNWVSKSDGAGDSDVEGEKGGISDAFKRAAVKWGVSRELYAMPTPWVKCEVGNNGKWRKWLEDPWGQVRSAPSSPLVEDGAARQRFEGFVADKLAMIPEFTEVDLLVNFWKHLDKPIRDDARIIAALKTRKAAILSPPMTEAEDEEFKRAAE